MFYDLPSPCYIVDEGMLEENLRVLRGVAEAAGCKILLAQKAFSMFDVYPLAARYLDGTAASGLYEARLSHEFFNGETPKENHVFSAAYSDAELEACLEICSHIVFNSFAQWDRFRERAARRGVNFGIRVNPEFSTQGGAESGIYDPCSPGSRLGVTVCDFRFGAFSRQGGGLNGIHFHTLCQQNSDALEATLHVVQEKFGAVFDNISWINFGGGHHITRADYDIPRLVALIKNFHVKFPHLEIYLEPGEAVALNAGFLHCTVLDIVRNGGEIAILDASAACHMPDVLEMPYTPRVATPRGTPLTLNGGSQASHKAMSDSRNEKNCPYVYTLAGPTCLAGDVIGTYSFEKPLRVGDTLLFEDMAIYSMVKNNTFNGTPLPAIVKRRATGEIEIVRRFGYEDFKGRLS